MFLKWLLDFFYPLFCLHCKKNVKESSSFCKSCQNLLLQAYKDAADIEGLPKNVAVLFVDTEIVQTLRSWKSNPQRHYLVSYIQSFLLTRLLKERSCEIKAIYKPSRSLKEFYKPNHLLEKSLSKQLKVSLKKNPSNVEPTLFYCTSFLDYQKKLERFGFDQAFYFIESYRI